MPKSLFFNALPDTQSSTGYDRNYNADDLSDFLSMVCDTGVVKTNTVSGEPQGLKVVAASGMTINVNAGKAAIKGKAFINDALESFTVAANGTTVNRYDYIVIKYDNNISVRNITLTLRTGTSAIPTAASLNRTGKVYELMLAYITVAPSATSITQANITDTRGNADLCPWFTAVKGYEDYYDAIIQPYESVVTMASAGTTVITTLAASLYNSKYSLIEVYTNGLKEPKSAYNVSLSGGVIVVTFTASKAAGAKIEVKLDNFIDGEGMNTALKQYTQLLNDVAILSNDNEFKYICNGVNDNILISNIIKAYLEGGTDYGSMKLNIIGTIGMTAAASGSGTVSSPYNWFDFSVTSNRKVILDFTRCSQIAPAISSGTYNNIFKTTNINFIGVNVNVSNIQAGTVIKVFDSVGGIKVVDSRFYVSGYQDSTIASSGNFENCRGEVTNLILDSYAFNVNVTGLLKVTGGEYYAYTGDSSARSAIVGQTISTSVVLLYGVNAPTVAKSGYSQTNSLKHTAGKLNCSNLISTLSTSVSTSNITLSIPMNMPNYM